MRQSRLSIMCLCFLFVCALSLLPAVPAPTAAAQTGPMRVVTDAQKSIDTADDTLFFEAVDADALLNSAADAVIKAVQEEARAGALTADNPALGMILGALASGDASTVNMVKPVLFSEIKRLVGVGIRGGFFAGNPNGKVSADATALASVLKSMSPERKEFVPGRVISQKDDEAVISATLVDKGAGRFPLELRLREQDGRWRVKEILNVKELVQKATGKS